MIKKTARSIYIIFLLVNFTLVYYGCTNESVEPNPIVDENNNGFETFEVAKIFAENCATSGCHSSENPQHGLDLSSYSAMLKGSIGRHFDEGGHIHKLSHSEVYGGEAVIPFHAEQSLLYNLISGNVEDSTLRMPYLKAPLSQSQIDIIKSWINNGAKDHKGNIPFSQSSDNIYVSSQGSDQVYVLDKNYNVVSRIMDVNFLPTPDAPHNIQGFDNYLYVSLVSTGRLLKININTNSIIDYTEGIERAGMIELSPDGSKAYVSRSSTSPSIYNTIYAVNTETMEISGTINLPVTGVPHAIALTSDGTKLYVANMSKDRISIVNAITMEYIEDIVLFEGASLVHEPMHMYLSPDDKYLYVNCRTSSKMLVVSTDTKKIIKELDIDHHPMQAAITKDGNKIYIVSHHTPVITEITKTGENWEITKKFESDELHNLYGADLSEDGKYLYMTCSNDESDFDPHYSIPGKIQPALVCVYNIAANELIKVLDTGSYATGILAHTK